MTECLRIVDVSSAPEETMDVHYNEADKSNNGMDLHEELVIEEDEPINLVDESPLIQENGFEIEYNNAEEEDESAEVDVEISPALRSRDTQIDYEVPPTNMFSFPNGIMTIINERICYDPTTDFPVVIKEEPADLDDSFEESEDYGFDFDQEPSSSQWFRNYCGVERLNKLVKYYEKNYNLRDIRITLERCDKIWKTLQLIKDAQDMFEQRETYDRDSSDFDDMDDNDNNSYCSGVGPPELLAESPYISPTQKREQFFQNKNHLELPDHLNHFDSQPCSSNAEQAQALASSKSPLLGEDTDFTLDEAYKVAEKREKPIVMKGKPTVMKEKSTIIKEKPTIIKKKSAVMKEKQVVVKEKPAVIKEKPLVIKEKPTVIKEKSTFIKEKPTVIKEKPTVSKEKPIVTKEKRQCLLCKKICPDMKHHLKDFHKVDCVDAIFTQCPIISEATETPLMGIEHQNHMVMEDSQSSKKRKRGSQGSLPKKKIRVEKFSDPNQLNSEPIKCPVCLGLYKTRKSYNAHRKIHEKILDSKEENLNCPDLVVNEPINKEDLINPGQALVCECGKSYRNPAHLNSHRVRCEKGKKFANDSNDTDSGISIDPVEKIKLRREESDSYEVVNDNDVSSNDSGTASISTPKVPEAKSISIVKIAKQDTEDEELDVGEEILDKSMSKLSVESDRMLTRRSTVPTITRQVPEIKKEEISKIQPIAFDCSGCYTTLDSVADVISHHLETRHNVTLHCPCGKKFVKLKFLNAHIQKVHSYFLYCGYCSLKFEGVENFCSHKCPATRGKPFHEPIVQTCCPYCKQLVDIGESFDIHVKEHTKLSNYHCFKCERVFEHLNQRKSHFNKEHGTYPCRYCGKQLQLHDLSKHEAYHDGHGHPCHQCRKAFTSDDALFKHRNNVHSSLVQEIVKCPTCEKSMKLRFLRKHLSFHLHDELCQKCNKCFKLGQDVTLDSHVAIAHPTDYPKITCELHVS